METLPAEIIDTILKFLPQKEFLLCSGVCKSFHRAITFAGRKLTFWNHVPLRTLANITIVITNSFFKEKTLLKCSRANEIILSPRSKLEKFSGHSLSSIKGLSSLSLSRVVNFRGKHLKTLNLEELFLTDNTPGAVLDSDIIHMTMLKKLEVTGTAITKSPSEKLEILVVRKSPVFLARSFGKLKNLTKLEFCNKIFTENILSLTKLKILSLYKNKSKISIAHLTNLTELRISNKILTEDLLPLTKLKILSLHKNKSKISISHLTNLTELNLSRSKVKGEDLEHLTKLQALNLDHTSISNSHVTHLKSLTSLDIYYAKQITADITHSLPLLVSLSV